MKIGDRSRFTLALLLLMMTGCAIRKPVQAMYCERMEQEVRTPKITQTDCHDGLCSPVIQYSCDPGFKLDMTGWPRCVKDTKHCAVWAKHKVPCVYNDQTGGCTEATK
jgi:hypothetical protein